MFTIDHVAFPCFDVDATRRFYTELLGGALIHSQSGPAEAWNAKEYLLLAFELPGRVVVNFFSFDGIKRPTGGALPKEIWHLALSLESRADVIRFKEVFERAGAPFWLETHDADDIHVYVTDPNGVTLEILAREDGIRARKSDATHAAHVVDRWLSARR